MPDAIYGPLGALAVLATVLAMLIRGDLVPGYLYKRERDKRDKSDAVLETIADTVKATLDRDRGGG